MSIYRLLLGLAPLALSLGVSAEQASGSKDEVEAGSYVEGDPEAGKEKSQACVACHGQDGNSNNPQWPNLAGQHAKYLYHSLMLYKEQERPNQVMWGQAGNLSEQDMKDLAAYYQQKEAAVGAASEEAAELGESIYRAGIPEKNVPACAACHGPAGAGNPGVAYPRLAGQKAEYTANALTAYREGERGDYDEAQVMNDIAENLSDEEIQAVSSYIAGLYADDE
jgi:cytochrome c553